MGCVCAEESEVEVYHFGVVFCRRAEDDVAEGRGGDAIAWRGSVSLGLGC